MYEKYATDALVLSVRDRGEDDRVVALYTEQFGLVRARAASARAPRSKMRGALVVGGHVLAGLVHGKRGWRAAGMTALEPLLPLTHTPAYVRVAGLVERLVQGEEQHQELFAHLVSFRQALFSASVEDVASLELLVVGRLLHALGYMAMSDSLREVLAGSECSPQQYGRVRTQRTTLVAAINSALAASQL